MAECQEATRTGLLNESRRVIEKMEREFPDQTATTELGAARKGRLDPREVARDLVANAAARVH